MVKNWAVGHRPFTAVTGVRIPVGTPNSKKPLHHTDSGFFIYKKLKRTPKSPKYYADFREFTRPLTTALIFPFA